VCEKLSREQPARQTQTKIMTPHNKVVMNNKYTASNTFYM